MSALGHKRTLGLVRVMSALPPKADINPRNLHVRFAPIADFAKHLFPLVGVLRYSPSHGIGERVENLSI